MNENPTPVSMATGCTCLAIMLWVAFLAGLVTVLILRAVLS